MSSSRDILSIPSEWPSNFPKPKAATRVITYIFDKDPTEFKSFVRKNFIKAQLKESKDEKGFYNITITEFSPNNTTSKSVDGVTTDSQTQETDGGEGSNRG